MTSTPNGPVDVDPDEPLLLPQVHRSLDAAARRRTGSRSERHASLRDADAPFPSLRTRRRFVMTGAGLATTAAVAVVAIAVDRGRPGTFVGEAGARELLRAAADATRNDPAPGGWRRSSTQRVQRLALEGRPCGTCALERAVLETRSTEELWSGPRGETYSVTTAEPPRAIENESLLRARHALDPPARAPEFRGTHIVPAPTGSTDESGVLGLGSPGALAHPSAVPTSKTAIVRWAAARLRAQDRAQERQAAQSGSHIGYSIAWTTRVSYALVDLATSPQLSGAQQAAAFDALADRPAVTASSAPDAFATPERVAIRIRAESAPGPSGRTIFQPTDRVIVFDRTSHRVVAEETQERGPGLRAIYSFGEGPTQNRMRSTTGGGSETRYGAATNVPGPGQDEDGRQITSLRGLLQIGRDGQSIPKGP
jgi:hypothetical protein